MQQRRNTTLSFSLLAIIAASCAPTDNKPHSPKAEAFDPTQQRQPEPSNSLNLPSNWRPPTPIASKPAERRNRVVHSRRFGVANQLLPTLPGDEDFYAAAAFSEPLRPVAGNSTFIETTSLASAINAYLTAGQADNRSALEGFVAAYPRSRWVPALNLNLGYIAYETGYFSVALSRWDSAWEAARNGTDPVSVAIANLALAELAKMNARLGRVEEIDRLFALAQNRDFQGNARVVLDAAIQGRWHMEHQPEISFMCGPLALANVATKLRQKPTADLAEFVKNTASPRQGFSLAQLKAMAVQLGLPMQVAYRESSAPLIVPALAHWSVGHFGALLSQKGAWYELHDPTFGGRKIGMSQAAIDNESSGYFLVRDGPLPRGWRAVDESEAALMFGRGHSGNVPPELTGPDDDKVPDCDPPMAMATYQFHLTLASLSVSDTPIRYDAGTGPNVEIRVTYNQREAEQPTSFDFINWGPGWVSNWVSYLTDNTSNTSADIDIRKRGGGGETHTDYDSMTFTFGLHPRSESILHRLTANTYKKVYPDGRVDFYEHYIGTTGTQRKVYLSRVVDAQGNEVEIQYDSVHPERIDQIVDASGLATTFSYDYTNEDYLVTEIEDPFGRSATFSYTLSQGQLRLQSIEDPAGIISSFTYNTQGEMDSLTTPYGTTTFSLSPLLIQYAELIRYVGATDPQGDTHWVEMNLDPDITGIPAPLAGSGEPAPDALLVDYVTNDMDDRNTFYWDKQQWKKAPHDYSKAHIYHWASTGYVDKSSGVLESERPPLEGRIWYNYENQAQPWMMGDHDAPTVVARVVDEPGGTQTTQAWLYEYNALGKVTQVTDPAGRVTKTEYASNNIDVTAVKQKTGPSTWETLVSYTYDAGDPPHVPATMTDAAGETTSYTYSSTTAQLLTVTNALSEVTTYTYETNASNNGYQKVLTITGDVPGGNVTFTYDSHDRVRTAATTNGLTLTYDYDDLDRVTKVTYPDSSYTQNVYEDQSLVATRDRAGRWSHYAYNGLRQRVVARDPAGRVTQTQWCRCGDLRRLVDGNGNITEWQRDAAGRVSSKVYADDSSIGYTYDFSGRLEEETDALDGTKTYEYTIDDRVSKIDYSDSNTTDVTFAYDANYGRVTSRVDGAGTTSFGYHANNGSTLGAGQVATINGPFTDDTLKYIYDELGRVAELQVVDDATNNTASYSEAYSYDARGRVTEIDNDLGQFDYSYDGQSSRVDTIDYPNGMAVEHDYFTSSTDYLLKQIKNLNAASTPAVVSQFDYTYNQDRTIKTWAIDQTTPGASTWHYGYDAAQQLTSAVRKNSSQTVLEEAYYGYDAAGNRTQVTEGSTTLTVRNAKVNELNQMIAERGFGATVFEGTVDEPASVTVDGKVAQVISDGGSAPYTFRATLDLAAGTTSVDVVATDGSSNVATNTYDITTTGTTGLFEYDLKGNLRYERAPDNSVVREYTWDQENRLVSIIEGSRTSKFSYDGLSRRYRHEEVVSGSTTEENVYIWSGLTRLQKRNAAGTTVERDYFQLGFQEGSADHLAVKDHLGSVREVLATNGTSVDAEYTYGPWGQTSKAAGSGDESDRRFTGHPLHGPSESSLAPYRSYNADRGRWDKRDPIGFSGGINVYLYAMNSPIVLMDPDGLVPQEYNPPAGNMAPGEAVGITFRHYLDKEKYKNKPQRRDPKPSKPAGSPSAGTPPGASPGRPKNLDRFHCMALCECSKAGAAQLAYCRRLADLKEWADVNGYWGTSNPNDSKQDQDSNDWGAQCPTDQDCYDRCR